jgi:hypothetical protein
MSLLVLVLVLLFLPIGLTQAKETLITFARSWYRACKCGVEGEEKEVEDEETGVVEEGMEEGRKLKAASPITRAGVRRQ